MFKRPSPFKHGCASGTRPCLVTSTYITDIIANINKPVEPAAPHRFVPIEDYKGYANALLKHGMAEDKVASVFAKHQEAMIEYTKGFKKKDSVVYRQEPIVPVGLVIRVNEAKGKVSVKLDTLSMDVHEKYFSKAKRPPLGEYIRSLVRRGYTEDQCVKVMDKYKWYEEHQEELEEELERRWPSAKGRKAESVKKVLKAVKKQ